jgi:hypothetical protein
MASRVGLPDSLKKGKSTSRPEGTGWAWTWRAQDPVTGGKWEDSADKVGGEVYPTVRDPLFFQDGNANPDDYVFVQPGARDTREGDLNYGLEWYAWPLVGGKATEDTAFLTPTEDPSIPSFPVYPAFRRIQTGLPSTWGWDAEPMYLYGANGETLKKGWNYLAHINKDRIQDQYGRSLKAWATFCCPGGSSSDSGGGGTPGDYGQPPWSPYIRLGCCPIKKVSQSLNLYFRRIGSGPEACGYCNLDGGTMRLHYVADAWGGSSPPVQCSRDGWVSDDPGHFPPFPEGLTYGGAFVSGAVCRAPALQPWKLHVKFYCCGDATTNSRFWGLLISVLVYEDGSWGSRGSINYSNLLSSTCIRYPTSWTCQGGTVENPVYLPINATFGEIGPPVFPLPFDPNGPCPWELHGSPSESYVYDPFCTGFDWYRINVSG